MTVLPGARGQQGEQAVLSNKDPLWSIFPTCWQSVSRELSLFLPQVSMTNKHGECNEEAVLG